jgi:hypothetical protein
MALTNPSFHAYCSCGRTELEGRGEPLSVVACYCDDCQAAGKQIDALPTGHGGASADGGTLSVLFRKDRVRTLRGSELLVDHKLRPESQTIRGIASCCNSNMLTRFESWFPFVALRTFSVNVASVRPQVCLCTKFAPDAASIAHPVPKHSGFPIGLVLKLMTAKVQLGFQRSSLVERQML